MYLIGDIGNTEIKLCLFDRNNKLIKKTVFKSNLVSKKILSKKLFFLRSKRHLIKTSIFSSVVPKIYKIINSFLTNTIKINCIELKQINLNLIFFKEFLCYFFFLIHVLLVLSLFYAVSELF